MNVFTVYSVFINGIEYYPEIYRSTSKTVVKSHVEYLKKFSWNNDKNITIKKLEVMNDESKN